MIEKHKHLLDELCLHLKQMHYSSKTIDSKYLPYWKKFLNSNLEKENMSDEIIKFCEELNDSFKTGKIARSTFVNTRRSIKVLEAYVNGWETAVRYSYKPDSIKDNKLLRAYRTHLIRTGKSQSTIRSYVMIALLFINFLNDTFGHDSIHITKGNTEKFIRFIGFRYTKSMKVVMNALRNFDRYLLHKNLISKSVLCGFSSRPRQPQHITRILAENEVKLLINSAQSKRDKAIILIAAETGIRSCDISKLNLTDIDWNEKNISIIQQKTEESLCLPLTTAVGNSIADYILNERPETSSSKVFISNKPPYKEISPQACWQISSKIMKAADIHQNENENKGLHCFRHWLSNKLLAKNIPLSTVSSVLGHKSKESLKGYIATDVFHLRQCALDLSIIGFGREEFGDRI